VTVALGLLFAAIAILSGVKAYSCHEHARLPNLPGDRRRRWRHRAVAYALLAGCFLGAMLQMWEVQGP